MLKRSSDQIRRRWIGGMQPQDKPRNIAVSLGGISNLDYTVLLCSKMAATRAFYRDIMKFPIETDLENRLVFAWVPHS
jgi:hypothetical protein